MNKTDQEIFYALFVISIVEHVTKTVSFVPKVLDIKRI